MDTQDENKVKGSSKEDANGVFGERDFRIETGNVAEGEIVDEDVNNNNKNGMSSEEETKDDDESLDTKLDNLTLDEVKKDYEKVKMKNEKMLTKERTNDEVERNDGTVSKEKRENENEVRRNDTVERNDETVNEEIQETENEERRNDEVD